MEGNAAVARDRARLVIYRPAEGLIGAVRSVRVRLDGVDIGACEVDGFMILNVTPGSHSLTVDLPDVPGACQRSFEAVGAAEYFFRISSRSESLSMGLAFGLEGQAAESLGRQCGGAYKIFPVSPAQALPRVQGMRLSN